MLENNRDQKGDCGKLRLDMRKKGKQSGSPLLIQIREELGECYVKIIGDAVRHLDGGILGAVFNVADGSPATINCFC